MGRRRQKCVLTNMYGIASSRLLMVGGTDERPQGRRERAKRHVTTRPHVFMHVHHRCHLAPGRAWSRRPPSGHQSIDL